MDKPILMQKAMYFGIYIKYRKSKKILGGKATLVVDRPFCGPCGDGRGVQNLVEEVGLDELIVKTPDGKEIIRPRPGYKRQSW